MEKYNGRNEKIQVNSFYQEDRPPGKRSRVFKTLVIVFCSLVLLLIGSLVGLYLDVSRIWGDLGSDNMAVVDEPEQDEGAQNLPEVTLEQVAVPTMEKTPEVIDVLLVGVDNRDHTQFTGRSDVTMFLRIDTDKKTIKLVSVMRDTLVAIDGHDKNKFNTAFHFGSVDLTYKTLQENFGLTPDYYVVVNFFGMEDIIDAFGGVDVTVEQKEIRYLRSAIEEINNLDRENKVEYIRNAGAQHLNGRQAVAYMRIRKMDGDAQRVERQHKVLEALFGKAMNLNAGQIPDMLGAVVEYVRTDIPLSRMLEIATAVRGMEGGQLQTFRYPEEFVNGSYDGMSVVKPNNTEVELSKLKFFLEQ